MLCRTLPKLPHITEPCFLGNICSQILTFCNKMYLKEGVCIHTPIIKLGLQDNLYLSNNLLSLYAKCYGLDTARHLFDEMPYRDVVSWTGMLSAYAKHRYHEEALELFDLMKLSGEHPNEFTLSSVLSSCSALGKFDEGICVQAYIMKQGYILNPILVTSLIDFYSKWGDHTEEAYKVFTDLDNGDTFSWTTMISSFVQVQNWNRAVQLYVSMIEAGVFPNEYTFVKILSACSFLGIGYGKLIHAHLIVWGVELNLVLKTALVDMYSKCQRMEDAKKASKQTPEQDVLLRTTMISGFTSNMKFNEAIAAFCEMQIFGIVPNNYTYAGALNACTSIGALELGKQIHSRVILTSLENDVSVGNSLVNLYMKCSNMIKDGLTVFRGITSPNVISWTSLIAGFAEHGLEQEAFQAFEEMMSVGEQPNSFTFSSILGICGTPGSQNQIRVLHGYIVKLNANKDIIVGNALVDAYAGAGTVDEAWDVVRTMNHRDAITYTSLVTRINQMGFPEMALNIIKRMRDDDVKIDGFSLASFLSASAGLGAMELGRQLHGYSVKSGLGSWISVSNGLVDFYGKCGCIGDAHRAFGEISEPEVISWNGLVFGLARNGHISSVLSTFEDMRLAGIKPDSVTLLAVLFACSHGGLVDLGLEHFRSMREKHDIVAQVDHYVCLVDLLGRDGRLEEALGVIETMPFSPDALIYKTLLGACRLHRNIPLGEDMARRGLELDPTDPAFYVLLAKMYDDSNLSDLGEKTRRLMRERGWRKNPGQSWMEVRNKVHLFTAGDISHPQINEIHGRIKLLILKFNDRGYSYENNRDSLYHSEKLAVAFGLLNAPSTAPIRIFKNLRTCRDCHDFIINVTLLVDREIIMRDGNRFHCFKKGNCSCRGYW